MHKSERETSRFYDAASISDKTGSGNDRNECKKSCLKTVILGLNVVESKYWNLWKNGCTCFTPTREETMAYQSEAQCKPCGMPFEISVRRLL